MKAILVIGAAVALSGCATLSDAKIGKTLCENSFVSRAALNLAIAEDSKIKDDALRQAALAADNDALAILNACPSSQTTP